MDKDYLKSISSEYRAGYDDGRASMIKEVLIMVILVAFLVLFLYTDYIKVGFELWLLSF